MLGSELVIRTLARRGVTTIFSLSGNQIMPLYDACIGGGIRIVHVRHEAAAVFMADGWAQVTGGLGVAMLTAGPGFANGVAPLYSAACAESPVLLLSGDSPIAEDGTGAFQEMDQCAIARPLTKASWRPVTHGELATVVDDAVATALTPRRGPVHVALPFDLLRDESGIDVLPRPAACDAPSVASDADVDAVARLLSAAERPVVLAGPSAARDVRRRAWQALAERLCVPVLALESPRGSKDPSIGGFAELIGRCDVVVLAGKPLDFTLGFGQPFGSDATIVVLDPDPAVAARAERLVGDRIGLSCVCDPVEALARVAARPASPSRRAWRDAVDDAIASRTLRAADTTVDAAADAPPKPMSPRALCERVQRVLDTVSEPIVVCDGGEFGQWAQAFCRAPVRIVNGPSGAIGGGLCYAIAAKLARPTSTVVVLMGDGTAGFHFLEFDTAVRERAAFVAVIGNDRRWNAEHLIQLRDYGPDRAIGCTLSASTRYEAMAIAMGAFGARANDPDELETALRSAIRSGVPACVDAIIDGRAAPVFRAPAHRRETEDPEETT